MIRVIARIVDLSRRHAVPLVAGIGLLAAFAALYFVRHVAIDTDTDKLISADLPWRKREAERRTRQNRPDLLP